MANTGQEPRTVPAVRVPPLYHDGLADGVSCFRHGNFSWYALSYPNYLLLSGNEKKKKNTNVV